jgi:ABC-2 type transport system ATP-binding protein
LSTSPPAEAAIARSALPAGDGIGDGIRAGIGDGIRPGIRAGSVAGSVADATIRLSDVSKFYGEILGVNRVTLTLPPGITSLIGPNGSGKTTFMNLVAGLVRPTQGSVTVLGMSPTRPEALFHLVGYCTQCDAFPRGASGRQFVTHYLRAAGADSSEVGDRAAAAIERVGMTHAADRQVAAYSKGMRQRIKLAQAIAHQPAVMLLDEPLNGLDPMARAEAIALFAELGREGLHLLISSHIMHEVDTLSDRVVILDAGYVVAEGDIQGVRNEIAAQPLQVVVRCDRPEQLGRRALDVAAVTSIAIHEDRQGVLIATRDAGALLELITHVASEGEIVIESVVPADEDVMAVYRYLVGAGQDAR